MAIRTPLAIDKTITLNINDSTQRVRLCAERAGQPPLLVVQSGPGVPLLHEVAKFQRRLHLERDFLVCYWDQRGCGPAPQRDTESVSLPQQVDDLRAILRWFHNEAKQPVVVLGISLGGTISLQAAAYEPELVEAVIAISPDAHTARSDAASLAFLREHSLRAGSRRLARRVVRLGRPPYVDPASFQRRASLLTDLGAIERRTTFNALVREMLVGMIRAYGVAGAVTSLRNLKRVQHKLLPEVATLDLLTDPPRLAVRVRYLFGEHDALTPPSVVHDLPAAIAAPSSTVLLVPDAGHLLHFDQPGIVRSVLVNI